MKLCKKSLSFLLAFAMLLTSVSVSFTSLAAVGYIISLTNAINDHYDSLATAIDSGDERLVPTSQSGIGAWAVEQDTYDSGWYYVAKAYAVAASNLCATYTSYHELNAAIIDQVQDDDNSKLLDYLYEEVLEYFAFGSTSDSPVAYPVTLDIATSFDLLYWDTIDEIDEEHEYYEGELYFSYSSGKISAVTFTSSELSDPFINDDSSVAYVKTALKNVIESADTWEYIDIDTITDDQLSSLVEGETSISQVLNSFDLLVLLTAYEPEEVWDHYIASEVGMTYAELLEWQETGLIELFNKAYAQDIQAYFVDILATDYSNCTGDEVFAFYNTVQAALTYAQTLTNYSLDKIATDVAIYFDDSAYDSGTTYWSYVITFSEAVTKAVALTYTAEYTIDFNELVNREVETYDITDEDAVAQWQGSSEEAAAIKFIEEASIMIENFETYVLDFCVGDSLTEKFYTVVEVFVDDPDSESDTSYIDYARYQALVSKLASISLYVDGSEYYAVKAYMDTKIDSWYLDGLHYSDLVSKMQEYETMYNKAVALQESDLDMYNDIFTDGLNTYKTYLNSIKSMIYERIGMQADNVTAYYSQDSGGVDFYNYESIIAAYEACEVKTATALNTYTGLSASGLVSSGMFETEAEATTYISTYTSKLTNITTYYNLAISYQNAFNTAISSARTNGTFSLYTFYKSTGYSTYNWETLVGKINTENILDFVTEMSVATDSGVTLTDIDSAMESALEELDNLIVSKDFAAIVGEMLTTTDADGNEVDGLGTWDYNYYSFDGKTLYNAAGTEISTITEYFINMVLNVLYSDTLPTMIVETIYPALAETINGSGDEVSITVAYMDASKGLSEVIATFLPSLPYHFYKSSLPDGLAMPWYSMFDDYSVIYADLKTAASIYTSTDPFYNSYAGESLDQVDFTAYITSWDDVNFDNWEWNINSTDSFYDAIATALVGLSPVLSKLMTGSSGSYSTVVEYIGFADIEVDATISANLSLYDSVFVPIYNILGLSSSEMPSKTEVTAACAATGTSTSYVTLPANNGIDLVEVLLEPIFEWLYNDLFANPIETILDLLPNLLAAIEYNQIIPLIDDLVITIDISIYGIDLTDMSFDVGSILTDMIDEMGIVLDQGVDAALQSLLSVTLTTSNPGTDNGLTVTDDSGNVSVAQLHVGDRANTTTYYYGTNVGLLANAMYSMFGDAFIEWIFNNELSTTSSSSGKISTNYDLPINIPVSTLIAAGSITTVSVSGYNTTTLTNYQIDSASGVALLVLFRWLFNDGGLDSVATLLEPMINGETEFDDDEETTMDMLLRVVDSQADNLMAILITLFNVYYPEYTEYFDAVADGTFTYTDDDGNEVDYLNDDGSSTFSLGSILTESLAATDSSDVSGTDKASEAVDSLDAIIDSALTLIIEYFAEDIEALGITGVMEAVEDGTITDLKSAFMELLITNDTVDLLMELLFSEGEDTVDDDGNTVEGTSLVASLLGSDTVASLLDVAAELGFDLTPRGFYISSSSSTTVDGVTSSTTGTNSAIHSWLASEAIAAAGLSASATQTQIAQALEDLTWADIGISTLSDSFVWFVESSDYSTRFDNFIALICDILDPLNPILSLLLTGEDITFFDTLTIRGNEGYSAAFLPLFDALGITVDSTYITGVSGVVEGTSATQEQFNQYVFGTANPSKGDDRFYTIVNSPIELILTVVKDFIIGTDETDGLLDGVISSLAQLVPNAAYMLYLYDEYDEDGNPVYDSSGEINQTNNFVVIVENLISPVTKILDIVDPILSRLVQFDISEMIEELLDMENTLNTMISQLLDPDWSSLTEEEQAAQSSSYIALDIFDFGTLAADSSLYAYDKQTSRDSSDTSATFTYFVADQGQVFITILRLLTSNGMIDVIANFATELINSDVITNTEDATSENNIIVIIQGLVERINEYDSGVDGDSAVGSDFIIGIIIQLLTDYDTDESNLYYYQFLNGFEDAYNTMTQTQAWNTYGVEYDGYDWNSEAAVEADLTKESVEDTVQSFDYVISEAVPDVIYTLIENGVLSIDILDLLDSDEADTTWEIIQVLLNELLFADDSVNWIFSYLLEMVGSVDSLDFILGIVEASGIDLNPESFLYDSTGAKSAAYDYLSYGYDSITLNSDGTVSATISGKSAEFSWTQIYENHCYETYSFDDDNNLILDSDGNPTLSGELAVLTSQYNQLTDEGGNYVYSYTVDSIEKTYTSKWAQLKVATIDGETYELEAVLDEDSALWSWGLDSAEGSTIEELFSAKKNQMFDILWSLIEPLSPIFATLFAGVDLDLFNDGVVVAGNNGYENVTLPILRALGLDQLLDYLDTTMLSEVLPSTAYTTDMTLLENFNLDKAEIDQLDDHIMTNEEYLEYIFADDGTVDTAAMGEVVRDFINYVLSFIEIFTQYPLTTISTGMPTIAYFIYGGGLTTLIENLLLPVTTITDQLQQIVSIDVDGMLGGFLDMYLTGSWSTLQASLQQYYTIDDEGNLEFVEVESISLTEILYELAVSFEFDFSSIITTDDETDDGMYSIILFINQEAELEAKAADDSETATEIRAAALKDFIKSIVAIGDSVASYDDLDSYYDDYSSYVYVSEEGQVTTSSAEVMMFLIDFIFENTTLKQILGSMLGVDITDENNAEKEVELIDEILTNVFSSPEVLVGVIIDIFTGYTVTGQQSVTLIDIVSENHYDFYEDFGFDSEDALEEDLANGSTTTASSISRIKTEVAIDSLDNIVASALDILSDTLLADGGLFDGLELAQDETLTAETLLNYVIQTYLASDDTFNSLVSYLVSALDLGEDISGIIDIVVDILQSNGYDLSPQAFAYTTVDGEEVQSVLYAIIGDAQSWGDIASQNMMYVYEDADETKLYSKTAGLTEIDGVAVSAVLGEDGTQEMQIHIDVDWGFGTIDSRDSIDTVIDVLWQIIEPLSPVLELFLTEQSLTLYDVISISGVNGYEGVILPIFEAFSASEMSLNENYALYDTYEEFYEAVYGEDGDLSVLFKGIASVLFDVVYSICQDPATSILEILPIFARYLESDALDVIISNLLSPVTYFADKISAIYDLDLVTMIKDALLELMDSSNEANDATTESTEVEDQTGAVAAIAAYAYNAVETIEDDLNGGSSLSSIFTDTVDVEVETSDMTMLDVIWQILDGVYVNDISITSLIPETIFEDIASCVWRSGSVAYTVTEASDGSYTIAAQQVSGDNVVDKASVIMYVLDLVMQSDDVKALVLDLIGGTADLSSLEETDSSYFLSVLISSVFANYEATEKLVIELLSFYDVEYAPQRVSNDGYDLNEYAGIDYDVVEVDETELSNLTSQLDALISAIVPVISTILPEGTLGDLELTGETTEDVLVNLVISLVLEDSEDSSSILTTAIASLIELIAVDETVNMVIDLVYEATGINIELSNFMATTPALAEYFAGCETWVDAYEMFYDEEAGKVVLTDTNAFGVESLADFMDLLAGIVAPFEKIFTMFMLGEDMVILDGIEIVAGDGYDRFLIPMFELFDIDVLSKAEMLDLVANSDTDGAFTSALVDYIEEIIVKFIEAPVETITNFIPQFVFYAYSGGLAQGVEQFLAPVITAVDKINAIIGEEFVVDGVSYVAFDINDYVTSWINEHTLEPVGLELADDLYDLIDILLTEQGLETVVAYWLESVGEEIGQDIYLGFDIDGMFELVLESCGNVVEVSTSREYGSYQAKDGSNAVLGFESSSADFIIGVVCDILLNDYFINQIMAIYFTEVDETIQTLIDAVTGENRYAIVSILLLYFNEYEVSTLDFEQLSFDKIDYTYSESFFGAFLTQYKLKRSLLKVDQVALSLAPDLIDMFSESETIAALLDAIGGYSGQSLEDLVNELLNVYVFNDSTINEATDLVVGLLSGDDLDIILTLVDSIVGLDLTPNGIYSAASTGSAVQGYFDAAAAFVGTSVENLTWSNMAAYIETYDFDWGIDALATSEEKREAVIDIIADFAASISVVVDFLFLGEDIDLISSEDEVIISLQGNSGYENALCYLFDAFALEDYTSADKVTSENVVESIIEAVFELLDNLLQAPIETLLTVLPTLAYFISSNGIEVFVTNLISPALAILDIVYPVAGELIEDLIGPTIESLVGDYLPDDIGTQKEKEVTDDEGNVTTETYMVYTLDELLSLADEDGSGLVAIINNILSSILVVDEDGNEVEVVNFLSDDFFSSYVEHAIELGWTSGWFDKTYNYVEIDGIITKIAENDYDSSMGTILYTKHVVTEGYSVNIADSFVYLVDTVVSEEILMVIADLLGVDLDDDSDMIASIIANLINGDLDALTLSGVIVSFFEGYDVSYVDRTTTQISTDKTYELTSDETSELEEIPSEIDSMIDNGLEVILEIVETMFADDSEEGILNTILDIVDGLDTVDLASIVDALLSDMVFDNEILTLIATYMATLLESSTFDAIVTVLDLGGYSLLPQEFLAAIKENSAAFGMDDTVYEAALAIYGDCETWAEVVIATADSDAVYDFGVTDKDSFVEALYTLVSPLTQILQFFLSGTSISLFMYDADEYIPVDEDDEQIDGVLGNGYVILEGGSAWQEAIIPLLEALGLYDDSSDQYDAQTNPTGVMSQAQFDELETSQEMVSYIFDLVFALVDEIVDSPIQWLSENLASIIYFVADDGLYDTIEALLTALTSLVDLAAPIVGEDILSLSVDSLTIDGILATVNDVLAENDIDFELDSDFLFELAGCMGEYELCYTLRTTATAVMLNSDGHYIDIYGNVQYDIYGNEITDISEFEYTGKTIKFTAQSEYFILGVIDALANEEIIDLLENSLELDDAIVTIVENLMDADGLENIVDVLIMLFNTYLNEYEVIEDLTAKLVKISVSYADIGVTQEETTTAVEAIDTLLGTVLGILDIGSIEEILSGYLYNDDTVSALAGMILDLVIGLDEETWSTIEMLLEYSYDILGINIELSVEAYAQGDGKLAELFTGVTSWQEAADKLDGFDWGITSASTLEEKTANLIDIVCDILAPVDELLEVFLAGGVYSTDDAYSVNDTASSISVFGEINIMGGSGYNYAIIPIFEALSISDFKTQAEYNTVIENESPLKYILETILGYVNENIDTPVSFVLSIVSNLCYFIAKDGLETVVDNLVAPLAQYLVAIEDILPISVNIDLTGIVDDTVELFSFYFGDEVAENSATVGLNASLDCETFETLVDLLIETYIPGLEIDVDFATIAAKTAEITSYGYVITTTSLVDPNWDISSGTVGTNITGNVADTLIVILEMLITTNNIEAILDLLDVDISALDESIQTIIYDLIEDPYAVIKLIVDLMNMEFDFETEEMIFTFLGELDYDYKDDDSWKFTVTSAINKLDSMVDGAAGAVVEMLATSENANELIVDIYTALGEDLTVETAIDYLLESYIFNDEMLDTIVAAVFSILGDMDESTLASITSALDMFFELDLTASSFAAQAGGTIEDLITAATASDETIGLTWADVAAYYENEAGEIELGYDWNITDADDFLEIVYELLTPLTNALSFILLDEEFGYELYANVIIPISLGLGLDLDTSVKDGLAAVEELIDGVLGLLDDLAENPITVILETVTNLSYFIACDGINTVVQNVLSPLDNIIDVVEENIDLGEGGVDALIESFIGISLTDIKDFAGENGENLITMINELIASFLVTSEDGEETQVFEFLSADFFNELTQYAVDVDNWFPTVGDVVTDWSVDKTDALMYLMMTICSEELLSTICEAMGEEDSTLATIIKSLAGDEAELIEVLLLLINEYDISYSKISQSELEKIDVDSSGLGDTVEILNDFVNTILELLEMGTVSEIVDSIVADMDIANAIIDLVIPMLAEIDLDQILDIVSALTNVDLDLTPQAVAALSTNSKLGEYIGEASTWQEVVDSHVDDNFDFEIASLEDVSDFFVDLLAALDPLVEFLLCGEGIVALEDESGEGNELTVTGGYGYNYAIIPLLEAFGVEALSQSEYEAYSEENGSHIKYIFDAVISLVEEINENPLKTILEKLANLAYFIGSDGINTVVSNLLAPINVILEEVDDAMPIAIYIDITNLADEDSSIIETYFGEEHDGIAAGISVDVSGEALTDLANELLAKLTSEDSEFSFSLDFEWNELAAMMAKTDNAGNIIEIETAQVYDLGEVSNNEIANLVNIQGDATDTLATIINIAFTDDNRDALSEYINESIGDSLDEEAKEVIIEILENSDVAYELIGGLVIIVAGAYEINISSFVYYYLGDIEVNADEDLDSAIEGIDELLINAIPLAAEIYTEYFMSEETQSSMLTDLITAIAQSDDNLYDTLSAYISDELLSQDMLNSIVIAIFDFATSLDNSVLTMIENVTSLDFTPAGFAASANNAEISEYVSGCDSWADVAEKNAGADLFSSIGSIDEFIDTFLELLTPFELALDFVLCASSIELGDSTVYEGIDLYMDVIQYIYHGLGFDQFGIEFSPSTDVTMAVELIEYVIGDLLTFIEVLCDAPVSTILTVVGNASFLIANDGLEVIVGNLIAPIEAILEAFSGAITAEQLDTILMSLTGISYSNLLALTEDSEAMILDYLNEMLGKIQITDSNGNVILEMDALASDFITSLAKASIEVASGTNVGDEVDTWTVNIADALMYILSTALDQEFITAICNTLELDTVEGMGKVINDLVDDEAVVSDILIKLFEEYTLVYDVHTQAELTAVEGSDTETEEEVEEALSIIDELIPSILEMLGIEADSLSDYLYSMIVSDDTANSLVSMIVSMLADISSDNIEMIEKIVNEATNLNISLEPQAFAADTFGSSLDEYIGVATSWSEVWAKHSEDDTATAFDFGIDSIDDFVNLICDMLAPVDEILEFILSGKSVVVLDEITVVGGDGYNYAIIPLLEAFGIETIDQEAYEAIVAESGSSIYYIIDVLIDRIDEILASPLESVLSSLANICYFIGNGTAETVVSNLVAPINEILELIAPIYPISIAIDVSADAIENDTLLQVLIGKTSYGVPAGITLSMSGSDVTGLIEYLLSSITINGEALGITLDIDWIELAAKAAKTDADGNIVYTVSTLAELVAGEYNSEAEYINITGSSTNALVALLELILTEDNVNTLLDLVGYESIGEPIDSIIEGIIENPASIIEIIIAICGGIKVDYINIQNREINLVSYDWSEYATLTSSTASNLVSELDTLIDVILAKSELGSLDSVVFEMFVTNDNVSTVINGLYGLLTDETVGNVLDYLADMDTGIDLDFTVEGYYEKLVASSDNAQLIAVFEKVLSQEDSSWAAVASAASAITDWGVTTGDIYGFIDVLVDVLVPFASLLEFFLFGEDTYIELFDVISIEGGDGYDYGIIPILEAIGLTASEVLTATEYEAAYAKDSSALISTLLYAIADYAVELLESPIDSITNILPNLAYFISNEGVYLALRNILSPIFGIAEALEDVLEMNFAEELQISKLLENIEISIELFGEKYGLVLADIDFYDLAQTCGSGIVEVATSRSYDAGSYLTATDPFVIKDEANKTTQTYIISNQSATLAYVLEWVVSAIGEEANIDSISTLLGNIFGLDDSGIAKIKILLTQLVELVAYYEVPDIIFTALFEGLGIDCDVAETHIEDLEMAMEHIESIMTEISNGSSNSAVSISVVLVKTILDRFEIDLEKFEDVVEDVVVETVETLNWFEKIIAAIKAWFNKLFGIS